VTASGDDPWKVPEAETVLFARAAAVPEVLPDAIGGAAPDEQPRNGTPVLAGPRGRHRTRQARASQPTTRRTWVSRAALAAVCYVQASLSLRLRNTATAGEAQYLTIGHLEIAHLVHGAPLPANYASTLPGVPALYPVLGAVADDIGGLAAARTASLLAMLITTVLLYMTTRLLFNEQVGVCAAALFGVTEGVVLAGNLATPDATSLCLVALACWIVVRTGPSWWPAYLLAIPVAGLAVGTYYWAVLCLPAVGVLGVLAALPYAGRRALTRLIVPAVVIAGMFAARLLGAGREYLTAALAATASRSPGGGQVLGILADAGKWGGLLAALAVFGCVRYAIRPGTESGPQTGMPGTRARRIGLGIVLTATAALTLADQIYLNVNTSLDTHVAFALLFAAPMAGVGVAGLVGEHYRQAQIGVLVWTAALILGLVQSGQIFGSWPDSSAQVRELSRYLGPDDHYLVENDDVAIYYLRGNRDAQPGQFTSTSTFSYRTAGGAVLTGTSGYLAALQAGYFHVIVYDGTATSALDRTLTAELRSNPGYRLMATVAERSPGIRTNCYIWVRTGRAAPATAPKQPVVPAPRRTDQDRAVSHLASVMTAAPTVALVASSIRIRPPVRRLRVYGSANTGWVRRSDTRPISFRPSWLADSSRCRVFTSSRY
jgi:hypothetical protein